MNVVVLSAKNYYGVTFPDSFWDQQTSEQLFSNGGTGKVTYEMKKASTYTAENWDFNTIWAISPTYNNGVPQPGWIVNATS
jgi:hypothetical protein